MKPIASGGSDEVGLLINMFPFSNRSTTKPQSRTSWSTNNSGVLNITLFMSLGWKGFEEHAMTMHMENAENVDRFDIFIFCLENHLVFRG